MTRRYGSTPRLASAVLIFASVVPACTNERGRHPSEARTDLAVGIGPLPSSGPQEGVQQLVQLLSKESLVRFTEAGRPRSGLVQDWTISPDSLSVKLRLRDDVMFHDGTPLSAGEIVSSLQKSLPRSMGPAFDDVKSITSQGQAELDFAFNRPSPFLLEALETTIQRPGAPTSGTGPYIPSTSGESVEMRANRQYYLGAPKIDRVLLNTYPTTRAAWADMLRGRIDWLYEVDPDAMSSLQGVSNIRLFTFTRHYQTMIVFNPASKTLSPSAVRRALNLAVDRTALINEALSGFGEPSGSPIWPHHWAFPSSAPHFDFAPVTASAALRQASKAGEMALTFTCLVPEGATYERLAIAVKRQLAAVGIDMQLAQVPMNELVKRLPEQQYEAALVDAVSAPTMFRPYEWWHSGGSLNFGRWGNPTLDRALDKLRHSAADGDYKAAVTEVQMAAMSDPPAIFLAWGQRARAVSTRFAVPSEPGRDVLATLRLWKPTGTGNDVAAARN